MTNLLPKIMLRGVGKFIPPPATPLNLTSNINDFVGWNDGDQFQNGILTAWDGHIAIINCDGKLHHVECD